MARFTYPQARLATRAVGGGTQLAALNGALVRIYSDAGATVLADIQTTGGGAIVNSELTVDANSQLPLFLGPDNSSGPLYAKAVGGSVITTLYPQIGSLFTLDAGEVGIGLTSPATPEAPLHVARSASGAVALLRSTSAGSGGLLVEGQDAASFAVQASVIADSQKRLSVGVDGKIEWGSGSAARDTNLYRNGPNVLKTDDQLVAAGVDLPSGNLTLVTGGQVNIGGSAAGAAFAAVRTPSTADMFSVRVTGDTSSRLLIKADGSLTWGSGTALDTDLFRGGAGVVHTNGILNAVVDVRINGVSLPRGILTSARLTANTATFTTEADLLTASAVTLVSGRKYRLTFGFNSVQSDVANDALELRLKVGATQYMMVALQPPTANRGTEGGTLTRLLACPGDIAAGSTTFKITGARVAGTGNCRLNAASNTTGPAELIIEDIGT